MSILKGQNLRLKVGGKYFAFATTCSIHIGVQLEESSTKDDTADWSNQEITGLSWDASTSALYSFDQGDSDSTGHDAPSVADLCISKEPVQVEFRITQGNKNREDATGPVYYGTAIINDFQATAQNRQNATYDVQLQGKGGLSHTPPTAVNNAPGSGVTSEGEDI
jgi:hypothetical protein